MNILATSDLHGNFDGLNPDGFDTVVIAGDFALLNRLGHAGIKEQRDWIGDVFVSWVNQYKNVQFVITPGNHDLVFDQSKSIYADDMQRMFPDNVRVLINAGCEISGVKFWGCPNIPIINYSWAFESDHDELVRKYDMIPSGIDVLVTHSPPRVPNQYVDVSIEYGLDSDKFGSAELANAIFRKRPRFAVCGHIHSGYHGEVVFGDTKVFNVSRVNEAYDIAYEPTIIVI